MTYPLQAVLLLIPDLEPLAGSGLSVSLAYLALERFRYRDAVENYAKEKKVQFKNEDDADTVEVVKDLRWLCRDDCNGHIPRGAWANIYGYAFRNKLDEMIIAFLAAMSGLTLVTGVAEKTGRMSFLSVLEDPGTVSFLFYACLGGLLVPAISVMMGRKCVKWCRTFADRCESEITKIHRTSARQAPPPIISDAEALRRQRVEWARRRKNPDNPA